MAITFKNPLGQAFGLAIRKERERLGLQSSEVAHAIGVKPSFYNLIENGSNYLHSNKSVMVVEAFECEFGLDGVTKVLMSVSTMEAAAREMLDGHQDKDLNYKELYFEGLSAAIDKLTVHDEKKIGRLLSGFDISSFSKLTPKESAKLIEDNSLDEEVLTFCRNYESYGNTPTVVTNNFFVDRINTQVPTIYFDFINDFIDGLVSLPVRINYEDMWKWEDKNKGNFKNAIGYIAKKELVISEENINRYHFNYLWEKGFNKARILVEGDANSSDLKDEFMEIFQKRLTESIASNCCEAFIIANASNKLKSLHRAMEKIEFRSITLQDQSLTTYQNNEEQLLIGVWVFIFNNQIYVGSMAKSNDGNPSYQSTVKEGINLSSSVTGKKYTLLESLWHSVKNG